MEKAFEIQKQVRDNAKTLQTYFTDLQNWEVEMKRKEAALNGEFEQDLPPVRSKAKKEKPVEKKKIKVESRIPSSDYKAWDSFDVDKACEEIDMEDIGPTSLDSKKSQQAKMEKLREEAHHEKERGNSYVKQEKWDEAISCYNRAIELVKDDAIYFANRGLCFLKKDNLHQAEKDCTEALRLDPTYVKALQRRATTRERLGSLRSASHDLNEVLKLEPQNTAARRQLEVIRNRMGTKGTKSKSSPSSTPTSESKPFARSSSQPKIIELPDEPATVVPASVLDKWRTGVDEGINVMKPVKKPPHLRSKRALKSIPIREIPLGKTVPEKPPTRLKIVEVDDDLAHGDSNNNDANKTNKTNDMDSAGDMKVAKDVDKITEVKKVTEVNEVVEANKVTEVKDVDKITEVKKVTEVNEVVEANKVTEVKDVDKITEVKKVTEVNEVVEANKVTEVDVKVTDVPVREVRLQDMVPPVNSVQFMAEWKYMKGNELAKSNYLSIIDPCKIPSIFENALESDVLSDLLRMLQADPAKFRQKTVTAYLQGLTKVKRFSALAMFLCSNDKEMLKNLLQHCKTAENCTENDIADLKNKFEL